MVGQMDELGLLVAAADGLGGSEAELVAGDVLRHLADKGPDGEHRPFAIAVGAERIAAVAA